ncbi:Sec-independent protein translocase protein TatB [Mesorhizobium sp. LHD-90]|uniref:Sec-independent protein translocase protein TatB n=1 Tax=Mesorhizobium sp. LHD-90 TaxID=3071414 RepID=UPI0027E0A7F5|nr:Sec-independent protein translocase protein TatB [Mesorhizobium sp. LHD-90]MDQ6434948.1 Sec-independent protein translocase protein TatB [Mesorhizobium sp. LHD-90]
MFDIGWTEMLVIAVVMIVVVGPKDLPKMLRTFGKMTTKMRAMAGDFQKQFNEALKEAELDDVKKSVDSLRSLNPANEIKKQLNPFEKAAADVRAGLQSMNPAKPATPPDPASPVAHEAEPLKNGATVMPGDEATPAAAAVAAQPAPSASPVAAPAAVPAPPPEPARPAAAAAPMQDPRPAKANGAAKPSAPKKPAAPRAAKAAADPKSKSAAKTPAKTGKPAAKAKPDAPARKPAGKST